MNLEIELSDVLAQDLAKLAEAKGLSVEALALELLERHANTPPLTTTPTQQAHGSKNKL